MRDESVNGRGDCRSRADRQGDVERLAVIEVASWRRDDPEGNVARHHDRVLRGLAQWCPYVEMIAFGVIAFPTRGPSRYLGGEAAMLSDLHVLLDELAVPTPRVGISDGLFAAMAAARRGVVVPHEQAEFFRRQLPVEELGDSRFADLARRLGLHRVGDVADLPRERVTERFTREVLHRYAVARGERDDLPAVRDPHAARRLREVRGEEEAATGQMSFFGDKTDLDRRAAAVALRVTRRLDAHAVWVATRGAGRDPFTAGWCRPFTAPLPPPVSDAPWPGHLPGPAPAVILRHPVEVRLADEHGEAVTVTSRGFFSRPPRLMTVGRGPSRQIVSAAGPWPEESRWWSQLRRRAHVQVISEGNCAWWLMAEQHRWWLAGIYD